MHCPGKICRSCRGIQIIPTKGDTDCERWLPGSGLGKKTEAYGWGYQTLKPFLCTCTCVCADIDTHACQCVCMRGQRVISSASLGNSLTLFFGWTSCWPWTCWPVSPALSPSPQHWVKRYLSPCLAFHLHARDLSSALHVRAVSASLSVCTVSPDP